MMNWRFIEQSPSPGPNVYPIPKNAHPNIRNSSTLTVKTYHSNPHCIAQFRAETQTLTQPINMRFWKRKTKTPQLLNSWPKCQLLSHPWLFGTITRTLFNSGPKAPLMFHRQLRRSETLKTKTIWICLGNKQFHKRCEAIFNFTTTHVEPELKHLFRQSSHFNKNVILDFPSGT